ncbi:MAG TPA: right-handed parallel beta-helix repeat-containing protein [Planctomycetota bacterium]|nr:right-handed parallel beta-helix repeat-containing protein [Planctomycetota bacterium]
MLREVVSGTIAALRGVALPGLAALAVAAAPPALHAQFVTGPAAKLPAEFTPAWAAAPARRLVDLTQDPRRSAADRGAELVARMAALQPGDELRLHGGTYQLGGLVEVPLRGEPGAPIRITGQPGERVVITRGDASQNVLNVGAQKGAPASYAILSGLEITGGSQGLRLLSCHHVWIDRCHIHHTREAGLTANSANTSAVTITRNEIDHTDGTGEGMYLGANEGAVAMSGSLVALNHVHDTGGTQGDGIELKQGSWGNRIVANHVERTPYPSIIVYGTNGRAINRIERNVCEDSGDNLLQVQGEALVANNLLLRGAIGIHSHDHQGKTRDLRIVHNTILTSGPGTDFTSWNGRPGMVFANNAVYSLAGPALSFPNGSAGVTLAGNVLFEPAGGGAHGAEHAGGPDAARGAAAGTGERGAPAGCVAGRGLSDFQHADWHGRDVDARPAAGSALLGAADARFAVPDDLRGAARAPLLDAGCLDGP